MNYLKFAACAAAIIATCATLADSSSAAAPSGRYTISNGTVFDNKTKLTWQQNAGPNSAGYYLSDAKTYCSGSAGGTWRLPTVKELLTLADFVGPGATLDPTAFPGAPADWYWSSTPVVGGNASNDAWVVYFIGAPKVNFVSGQLGRVRCVH